MRHQGGQITTEPKRKFKEKNEMGSQVEEYVVGKKCRDVCEEKRSSSKITQNKMSLGEKEKITNS